MEFLNRRLDGDYRWRDYATLGIPFETWKESYPVKSYKPFEMVLPKQKIGIEVEVERVQSDLYPHANIQTMWQIKEDGSLRNGGREFVSIPLQDQMIPYAVHFLFDEYLSKKADFSERTSLHVHANVRSWTQGNVLTLMLLYIVFEKMLYKFAGPRRYKNIFCVPIQETKLPVAMSDYLANQSFASLIASWAKYSGLNLIPIKSQGSVEFRHMEGHRDPLRLMQWISIIQRMMKAASRSSFQATFNAVRVLNTTSGYEQFLNDIFREQARLLDTSSLQRDMEYGVSVVKAVREPTPFLTSLLAAISNESPLLKALGVSEKDVKKVASKADVAEIPQIQADVPVYNWNARDFAYDELLQQSARPIEGYPHPYPLEVFPRQVVVTDSRDFPNGVWLPAGFAYTDFNGNAKRVPS